MIFNPSTEIVIAHPYKVDEFGKGDTSFRPIDLWMNSTHILATDDWNGEIESYFRNGTLNTKFGTIKISAGSAGGLFVNGTHIFNTSRADDEVVDHRFR